MITKPLIRAILANYVLDPSGIHGVKHWARVLANGRRLAESTGANRKVIELFAVFHDACRISDGADRNHGPRGAELAKALRGSLFALPEDQCNLLYSACADHTRGMIEGDITIQTCWDADRLDLPRVGITPKAELLCTSAARERNLFEWATRRAILDDAPSTLRTDWGIHEI